MRIGVDGTPLVHRGAGIASYTEDLVRALARLRPADQFVLVANAPMALEDRRLPANMALRVVPSWLRSGSLWSMTRSAAWARRLGFDLFHSTNSGTAPLAMPCPHVLSVHDLTPLDLPQAHPLGRRLLARAWWPVAVRRAGRVLAPTRKSAEDVRRAYGVSAERIDVVPYAAAEPFGRGLDAARLGEVRRRLGLPHPFLLNVSTWEPRKNQPALIRAFGRALVQRGLPHDLLFTGRPGWGQPPLEAMALPAELRRRVRHLGLLSRDDLAAVYRLADFAVYPSLGEGFGLPNLEAMASGTPVLTSLDAGVAEVVGDAALRVDASDPEALAEAIVRMAVDGALRQELRRRGLERARLFSWEAAARRTWATYASAAGRDA